jgi:hypothetical protein
MADLKQEQKEAVARAKARKAEREEQVRVPKQERQSVKSKFHPFQLSELELWLKALLLDLLTKLRPPYAPLALVSMKNYLPKLEAQ